jgi:hypothetical protein
MPFRSELLHIISAGRLNPQHSYVKSAALSEWYAGIDTDPQSTMQFCIFLAETVY